MAAVPVRVSALLDIKGLSSKLQGWGKADITGIPNPTLKDVWRQLIVNFEGKPGGDRYRELPAQYKDPNEYRIELLRLDRPPDRGPPFTMAMPYIDGQFPYLAFVYAPKGPDDPTPLEDGGQRRRHRRRASKRTRGRRSLSTRAASRGTRRY
jgi:hypothetical protein